MQTTLPISKVVTLLTLLTLLSGCNPTQDKRDYDNGAPTVVYIQKIPNQKCRLLVYKNTKEADVSARINMTVSIDGCSN